MDKPENTRNNGTNKFRILSLLIILFFLTISLSCGKKPETQVPTIKKGLLDLTSYDIEKEGKLEITGECQFFWKKALNSTDFNAPHETVPDGYIHIPGMWNKFKINGKEIGRLGYATFRFKVRLLKIPDSLSFKFQEISSAYNLFIDDKKITSVGTFAASEKDARPGRRFQVVSFKPGRKEFNVIFQVSNFHSNVAGFWSKIYLGETGEINTFRSTQLITDFFIFGCIFILFVYHLGFFFLRRKDKSTLFFSFGCLCLGAYTLTTGEIIFYEIFPNLPWSFSIRLMFISAYLSLASLSYFMYYIFTEETNIYVAHYASIISITFTIITAAVSIMVCVNVMIIFCGIVCLWSIYTTTVYVSAIKNKSEGSLIFLLGTVILISAIANDVMHGFSIISTAYIIPFGILGFIFSQAMLISRRFSNAYETVEDLNLNLEKKVDERTEELEAAMEELEAMNDTLQLTNQELVDAQETARKDMVMAANVQASLLPKELPSLKNWDIAFEFKPLSGVSGDLYDIYIQDGRLEGISICDVSGHGIASGLITMIARSAFYRNFREFKDLPLNIVLNKINHDLIGEIDNSDNYLSSILIRFNGNTAEYVNAGHTDLLRKKGSTGKVEIVDNKEGNVKGLYMGLSATSGEYNEMTFTLEKDDVIILYSDCIIESENTDGEPYGVERLTASLEKTGNIPARETLNSLISGMYDFTGKNKINDDLTVVVLKYLGQDIRVKNQGT